MSATEALRSDFFRVAAQDETLGLAMQAQVDMAIEGDFAAAKKLNTAISKRLELLDRKANQMAGK
jgi:hypothetical protein